MLNSSRESQTNPSRNSTVTVFFFCGVTHAAVNTLLFYTWLLTGGLKDVSIYNNISICSSLGSSCDDLAQKAQTSTWQRTGITVIVKSFCWMWFQLVFFFFVPCKRRHSTPLKKQNGEEVWLRLTLTEESFDVQQEETRGFESPSVMRKRKEFTRLGQMWGFVRWK